MIKDMTKYKIKFAIFMSIILLLLLLALFFIKKSFASYVVDADINVKPEKAIYFLDMDTKSFNIELTDIVPSENMYYYSFTIANYDKDKRSDVDLEYNIKITTTTNLPLIYKLYRNEVPTEKATNIISSNVLKTDEDNSWYRELEVDQSFKMHYTANTKDTYYLAIEYPITYAKMSSFSGAIESIEVELTSRQIIE